MARVGTTGRRFVRGRALRADLAFRQPLDRDLRRAVTHRAHLFLFCSLHRSRHGFERISLSPFRRCITGPVLRWARGRIVSLSGPFRRFDRFHSPWPRDWSILHSASTLSRPFFLAGWMNANLQCLPRTSDDACFFFFWKIDKVAASS